MCLGKVLEELVEEICGGEVVEVKEVKGYSSRRGGYYVSVPSELAGAGGVMRITLRTRRGLPVVVLVPKNDKGGGE